MISIHHRPFDPGDSPEHLRAVEDEINARPRLVLADHTPTALFQALLTSPDQQRCDVR